MADATDLTQLSIDEGSQGFELGPMGPSADILGQYTEQSAYGVSTS